MIELKDEMPENSYLRLSNSLKRAYDMTTP